ncbi:MAG: hypothetical protein WHT07_11940 [Desulfobaccales bacterium]
MKTLFTLALRFFACFVAAKFLLGLLGEGSAGALLLLTSLLVANLYLFDLLDWYYEGAWRRALTPKELGWLMTRLTVWLNRVRGRPREPQDPSRPPESGTSGK